jgi:SH3-like domain-containing protein
MPDSPPIPDASGPFRRIRGLRRHAARASFVLLMLACITPAQPAAAQEDLPLPRFASFKSNEVNMRAGPGENYPKRWVYQRAEMPVEIIDQEDTWRQIRDYQGVVGWVSVNLLTSKRTAIMTETRRTLRDMADANGRPVALLEPGVIGRLQECSGDWCRLEVKGPEGWVKGWLKRTDFWGVYPTENFKN